MLFRSGENFEADGGYHTVAGLILDRLGRLPTEGEHVEIGLREAGVDVPRIDLHDAEQRPVGPEETDSMNHILGMFGLSLVDPQNIEGHPNQYKPRAPVQNHPNYVMRDNVASPHQNNLHSNNPFSQQRMFAPSGSVAGIEHLPRPSGRYAQRRYDSPSTLPLGNDYRSDLMDRDYRNTAANPPLAPNNSVSPSGIATASFARDSSNLNDYSSSDWNSRNPSPSSAGQEVERFQTPQIQDALVQLSVIVSRPSEQWNLAPLRDSAMMWIERGETPLIRGEARLLLDRIERFEAVRQRSSASPLTPPSNYSEGIPLRSPASDSEMSGWLVAVHTSLPGQPEFALTDDLGNVKAYVRPTTGLNLRRYVQQPVTVFGPQGYLPNLGAKQVVADRVVRLR